MLERGQNMQEGMLPVEGGREGPTYDEVLRAAAIECAYPTPSAQHSNTSAGREGGKVYRWVAGAQ
jgi:hypothetical protein